MITDEKIIKALYRSTLVEELSNYFYRVNGRF